MSLTNGIAKEMIHGCLEDVRGTKFVEVCNLLISRRSGVFLDGSFVINITRGTFFVWSQLVFTCSGVPKNRNLGCCKSYVLDLDKQEENYLCLSPSKFCPKGRKNIWVLVVLLWKF